MEPKSFSIPKYGYTGDKYDKYNVLISYHDTTLKRNSK